METLNNDRLTIDDVLDYLNKCAIEAARGGRFYGFTLYTALYEWLNELKRRREEDTDHTRECALEVVREDLNNGGPFTYEEWCKCTHCGYKQALFIPRNYCPKCGYKFTSIIHKGDVEKED